MSIKEMVGEEQEGRDGIDNAIEVKGGIDGGAEGDPDIPDGVGMGRPRRDSTGNIMRNSMEVSCDCVSGPMGSH